MADQYNENQYDQQAQQSGQEFRSRALNTGYDYFRGHKGNSISSAGTAESSGKALMQGAAQNATAPTSASMTTAGGTAASTGTAAGAGAAAGTTVTGAGASAGTAVAAGAPTAGVGALAVLVMSAFKAGADKVKAEGADISQTTDIQKESRWPFLIAIAIGVIIVICCIILLIPSCAMFFPQLMERDKIETVTEQHETTPTFRFFNAHSDKNEFFREILGVDSYNIAADNIVQEYRQIDNTNIDIYKSIIDHAIWNAFNKHALSYCTDYDLLTALDFIADKDMTFEDKIDYILFFDEEAALENYRSKQYPYTAMHDNGFYYTIGDYLDGNIPDEELNNLLNYAEIITVLSQSEECAANTFSYSSFYDMLTSEQAEMLLFEIEFDKERTWSHEVVEEIEEVLTEDNETNGGDAPDNVSSNSSTQAENKDNPTDKVNKEDNGITVEPVNPIPNTPTPKPQESSNSSLDSDGCKKDNGERDKDNIENSSPSKTNNKESSKDKGKRESGNTSNNTSAAIISAEYKHFKYMAFTNKVFRVVIPSGDMIGGQPVKPTPTPSPTNTPIPTTDETDTDLDGDSSGLAGEIAKRLIYKYGFYYDCEIAPYGLLELYTIADTDPTEMNANEYTMRNIDVLDISEKWLRTKVYDVSLGVNERSPMQYLKSEFVSKGIEGLFNNSIYYKNAVSLRDQLSCNYIPDGQSVILDMQGYINQGKYPDNYRGTDGRGQSIKTAGCCDCSYTMIAMYLNRANYDIVSISKNYVTNNNFRGQDYLSSVGLKETVRDAAYSSSTVVSYLTEGLPVMLHISGKWVYNGVTYHSSSNGHFLVIMGFDDTGFYVYDPGSNKNTTSGPIPYAAFSHVSGKSIRVVTRNSTFRPYYLVNTYLDE